MKVQPLLGYNKLGSEMNQGLGKKCHPNSRYQGKKNCTCTINLIDYDNSQI